MAPLSGCIVRAFSEVRALDTCRRWLAALEGVAQIMIKLVTLTAIIGAASMARPAAVAGSEPLRNGPVPFIREWRVVMSREEAGLLPYAGVEFTVERRQIGAAQLDALDALLLPPLAARLTNAGAPDPPSSYFRQYAAARAGKYHLILVHGVLRDAGHSTDWTHKPADASDGRVHFWDAVYIVERHRLVKLKQKGDRSAHVIMIQGSG